MGVISSVRLIAVTKKTILMYMYICTHVHGLYLSLTVRDRVKIWVRVMVTVMVSVTVMVRVSKVLWFG